MQSQLIALIAGLVVLAIFIVTLCLVLKNKKNKAAVEEFLTGLTDELTAAILATIKAIDPSQFETLEQYEAIVLKAVYDNCWTYTQERAEKAFEDNPVMKTVIGMLDKDTLIKFIDNIIDKKEISIMDVFGSEKIENSDIEEQEQKLVDEFATEEYNVENEVTAQDLEPAVEEEHTEEEIAALNPQKDEEEVISAEDSSVEIFDELPKVVKEFDKIGRPLFYEIGEDGKKTRVTKAYAAEHGVE